jgi:asparagine synthase (glutamine-hydrolysing)
MRCFTVGFADAPDMSESPAAARTAAQFGLEHRDIQVTGQTAQDSMERWLRAMDQPSLDGLNTFIVSQAVRKEGIIVALSGLGGDELLGGYPSFETLPALHAANRRLRALPSSARAALFALAGVGRPGQVRDKLADMGRTGPDLLRLYIHRRRAMSDKRLAALGLSAAAVGLDDVFIPKAALAAAHAGAPKGADADHLAAIARYECSFYMRNVLLRDSDANGMAHSLEIRVPMLDRRVLDLCHAIPGKVRLPSGRADKHLLRTAFKDLLRPELLNQTKKGFTLPIRRWMSGPLRPMCEAAVSKVKDSGLVSPSGVDTIWRTFLAQPEMQVWSSALALVALGSYLTQSCTKPPAPPR